MLIAAEQSAVLRQSKIMEDLADQLRLFPDALVGVENVLACPNIEHNPATWRIFIFFVLGNQVGPLQFGPIFKMTFRVPHALTVSFPTRNWSDIRNELAVNEPKASLSRLRGLLQRANAYGEHDSTVHYFGWSTAAGLNDFSILLSTSSYIVF